MKGWSNGRFDHKNETTRRFLKNSLIKNFLHPGGEFFNKIFSPPRGWISWLTDTDWLTLVDWLFWLTDADCLRQWLALVAWLPTTTDNDWLWLVVLVGCCWLPRANQNNRPESVIVSGNQMTGSCFGVKFKLFHFGGGGVGGGDTT